MIGKAISYGAAVVAVLAITRLLDRIVSAVKRLAAAALEVIQ